MALRYADVVPVVTQYGNALAGKVIVDISNPFNAEADGLAIPDGTSIAQEVAKVAPAGASVVKAFNATRCRPRPSCRRTPPPSSISPERSKTAQTGTPSSISTPPPKNRWLSSRPRPPPMSTRRCAPPDRSCARSGAPHRVLLAASCSIGSLI